jgi:MFS family permease
VIEPPIAEPGDAPEDGAGRWSAGPMRRLSGDRNYRRLAIGQTLTQFGDFALMIVLAIWVKSLTGSSALAGSVFLAIGIPALVSPLFGMLIDRFPRRRVMIVHDLLSAAAVMSLVMVGGREDVWIIFAVALLYGVSSVVTYAARAGLLVSMLPDDLLGEANGVLASAGQGVRIAAPLVGAGLFALWGGPAVAAFDAATFLASACLLWLVRSPDLVPTHDRTSFVDELTAGVRHIWATPELRRIVTVVCMFMIMVGLTEVAFFEVVDQGLHRPPAFLGILATIQGVGAIAGGLTAGAAMRRLGETGLAAAGLGAFAIGFALVAVAVLPTVIPGAIMAGVGNAYFAVGFETLMQRRTAPELQGRVFGAADAVIALPATLSLAVGAAIVSTVDYRATFALGSLAVLAGAVALMRGRDRVAAPEPLLVVDGAEAYAAEDSISGA